jgi:hypothetical protein
MQQQKIFRMVIMATLYAHGPVSLRREASTASVDWMKLQWYLGEEKGIETYTEEMLMNDQKTWEHLNG